MKLDEYYKRKVREITERDKRLSMGTGGDVEILLAIIKHIEKPYPGMAELLLKYDARHKRDCPQAQQNYWRMRPEYHPDFSNGLIRSGLAPYGPDRLCTCGLDEILGKPDDRGQG